MTAFNISGLVSGIDTSSLIDQLMTAAAAPQTALQTQVTTDQTTDRRLPGRQQQARRRPDRRPGTGRSDTWNATTATSSSQFGRRDRRARVPRPARTRPSRSCKVATAQITTVAAGGAAIADPAAGIDVIGADGTEPPHRSERRLGRHGRSGGQRRRAGRAGLGDQHRQRPRRSSSPRPAPVRRPRFTDQRARRTRRRTWSRPRTRRSRSATRAPAVTRCRARRTPSPTPSPASRSPSARRPANVTISVASDRVHHQQQRPGAGHRRERRADRDRLRTPRRARRSPVTAPSRRLQQKLLGVVAAGTSTGGSLRTYGISLTSTGSLTFDAGRFAAAYSADPTGTQTAVSALATSMSGVATAAADPNTGSVTQLINSREQRRHQPELPDRRLDDEAGRPEVGARDQVRGDGGGPGDAEVRVELPVVDVRPVVV